MRHPEFDSPACTPPEHGFSTRGVSLAGLALTALFALFALAPGAAAQVGHAGHAAASVSGGSAVDSAAVVGVVARFHGALEAGDSTTALTLLAADVLVLESGGVETREEYRGHHLPGDIGYARAVPSTRTVRQVKIQGMTAWVSSTSVSQGTYNGRAINSMGAELAILTRGGDGHWRIAAIHWSSRARRNP